MKLGAVGLLSTAALLVPAVAQTAPAPLLTLDVRRCPEAPAAEVSDMVSVELRRPVIVFDGANAAVPESSAITVVRVTCESLRAEINVSDPLTGKAVARVVDLSAAPPLARPHLLALSIVELLAASWLELESASQPKGQPLGASTPPGAREAALDLVSRQPGARRPPRLLAVAATQISTRGPSSWGGGAVIAGTVGSHFGWLTDLGFQHGEQTFALGQVTADTASMLAAALAGTSRGRASLRAGLGARGGAAWLSGAPAQSTAAQGATVRGFWWGPAALLDGSVTIRGRLVLELAIEGGRILWPVVGTVAGSAPVAIDGLWLRGTLGVGITL